VNSDDIDYLKGFTVMGKKDAIAEAWNILKEEENKSCSKCAEKDMIIQALESYISRMGRWIEQTGASHDVEPGLEFEENVASHDPRGSIYEPENPPWRKGGNEFNSDVAEGGQ